MATGWLGKETRWKNPETKGHNHVGVCESQLLNGLQGLLSPGSHTVMKSPPTLNKLTWKTNNTLRMKMSDSQGKVIKKHAA